jgi:predicted RNase H-like HicB family nuclease
MNQKTLDDLMALWYPYEVAQDDETGWFVALHPDLPGCIAQGATAEEAIFNLTEARQDWLEYRLTQNLAIPEPTPPTQTSSGH